MDNAEFMLLALETSRQALPNCLPNPPVGCVIVHNGHVIATCFPHKIGSHHAEIDALSKISRTLKDCNMYVTLEPCSFIGRTPSCAMEIVKRKVRRLYVAIIDPHVKNNGKGIDIIKEAHIPVVVGLCSQQVSSFLTPYLCLS